MTHRQLGRASAVVPAVVVQAREDLALQHVTHHVRAPERLGRDGELGRARSTSRTEDVDRVAVASAYELESGLVHFAFSGAYSKPYVTKRRVLSKRFLSCGNSDVVDILVRVLGLLTRRQRGDFMRAAIMAGCAVVERHRKRCVSHKC